MAVPRFTFANFALRWVFALILVFGTFNPTPYSFVAWLYPFNDGQLPFKALAGITLVILYVIYIRATFRSIGWTGVMLAGIFLAALLWVLITQGILSIEQPSILTWVVLFAIATIMAIGLSWSHVRRRLSGQADVDDVES
jgi:hypothetical protein